MQRSKKLHVFWLVALVIILGLAACGGAPVDEQPSPPEAPAVELTEAPTEEPTETPAAEPTPSPPDVTVSLPQAAIAGLMNVAASMGYDWQDLAANHTVFYTLPDTGIAFLLTPIAGGPGYTATELAQEPGNIENLMLGGLTVITGFDGFPFAEGDYLITLAPDGESILFAQADGQVFPFPAVIRELPQQLPRELALITSSQICLAWNQTQVCALVDAPLPSNLKQRMSDAIDNIGINPSSIALDRAIPDAEGFKIIETCAEALSQEPPEYDQCRSTVLAAPAVADGAFDVTGQEEGTSTGIALLVALEDIEDQVFLDPQLTQLAEGLPAGDYLTYEVLLPGETPTQNEPIPTRVMQEGPVGRFYLPAQSGGVIIGDSLSGSGPDNSEEAIIANMWCRGRCYFKWWQCSGK